MKLVLATLFTVAATPIFAQGMPVRLKDGASWTITANHTRNAGGTKPAQNWGLTTSKRLTFHAGRAGQPDTITVTPLSAVPDAGSPPEIAQARSLSIPATLVVDDGLSPTSVVNKEETRATFLKLAPNADPIGEQKLIDAAVAAMIASELEVAARVQGLPLKLSKTIAADKESPNPLGGPAIQGVESAKLVSLDKRTGRAEVEWSLAVDPKSLKESTLGGLLAMAKGRMSPEKIEELKGAFATASMESENRCRFEVDMRSGLATMGECNSTFSLQMQGNSQRVTEHWLVTQTLPETA
jgi:hypothetical protein